ncbi:cyd operon protein YbgE [Erwinia sp. OLTSP20]|uniref:cyd operon protein YbgE n=1 Tax=unclassified Erwinia TaxID=2622719 RepID=UPI000C18058A|nr:MULTISPECIES: cyd operon protein YbgE [unclassified Erwinia]PIJ48754.1 cyd operon protein YbgE [Erwinia sp. OAMSP11]PIJ69378.1 cyd operon protein YbgE [Erwinia sp. OLSSP12]PIJ79212.1 cyd operon protein YbgE [Erwinia sp. OLCASP19]PIJ80739.1 cyd operon protein YbgE [Erwinia sp. OLMTSP26]PIJ82889.1 cyd operon protein YbgE [Erwinia sp. OLMDSP33]
MKRLIAQIWQWMDRRSLRLLSLLLALWLAGCLFWAPARFASHTSSLSLWQGWIIMWGVCASVVFGVGFQPQKLRWRALFLPLPALLVVVCGLVFFYS